MTSTDSKESDLKRALEDLWKLSPVMREAYENAEDELIHPSTSASAGSLTTDQPAATSISVASASFDGKKQNSPGAWSTSRLSSGLAPNPCMRTRW